MKEVDKIQNASSMRSYAPAILAIAGSLIVLVLRMQIGPNFISDGALMMLALASYIFAALFHLTNLYAPSEMARKIGLFTAALGVFFNLSSWLVRWVAAYDRELAMLRDGGSTNLAIFACAKIQHMSAMRPRLLFP